MKTGHLGGQVYFERDIPFKKDLYNFIKVLERRLEKVGVDVRMNTVLQLRKQQHKILMLSFQLSVLNQLSLTYLELTIKVAGLEDLSNAEALG